MTSIVLMDAATIDDPLPAARRGGNPGFDNPLDVYLAIDRAQADAVRRRARRDRVHASEAVRRAIADAYQVLALRGELALPRSRPGPRRPRAGNGLRMTVTLPGALVVQLDAIARYVAARQGEPDLLERTARNELVRRVIQWSENQ